MNRIQELFSRLIRASQPRHPEALAFDGRIDESFYARKTTEWKAEQEAIRKQLEANMDPATIQLPDLCGLAGHAAQLFAEQSPHSKRKVLEQALGEGAADQIRALIDRGACEKVQSQSFRTGELPTSVSSGTHSTASRPMFPSSSAQRPG